MKLSGDRFTIRTFGGLCAAVALFAASAHAQIGCSSHWQATGAPYSDFDRTFQLAKQAPLTTAGVVRTGWSIVQNCSAFGTLTESPPRFEWSLLPISVLTQNNSAYPRVQEDGLRWAGRGWSGSVSGGAAGRWGPITAAFAPIVTFQQNKSFAIQTVVTPDLSPYGSYYHVGVIDRPQRFGSTSFSWIHPGQSFVRVDAYGFKAGVSTENLRWGPARRNPILMSNGAAGIPHVFVGTEKPVDLRIVQLGVEAMWGRLSESNYFDDVDTNDSRGFAGFTATVTPKNSGLTVGIARAYLQTRSRGLSLIDEILGPYIGIRDNPQDGGGDNQLISVFAQWALPDVGFEAYGEYAREDHWEDARDLLMQPDHSRGYTIGFEKVFLVRANPDVLRVSGEATNLGFSPTWQSRRPGATFYVHNQVRQGYTQRGQVIGAPIGPGADAQYLAVDYLTSRTLAGLYYTRARYDNDVYYRNYAFESSNRGHDAEWTLGLRGGTLWRNLQIVSELAYSTRHNREFVQLAQTGSFTRDNNFSFTIGAAWLPHARRTDQ